MYTQKEIHTVLVAGSGVMGASFAQIFAQHHYDVILYDIADAALEKAKNLILYSPFSMTQIADMLGFSCLSAFTRAFKNQYHVHPSSFRKTAAR